MECGSIPWRHRVLVYFSIGRDDPWSSVVSNEQINNTDGKITVLVRELHVEEKLAFAVDNSTPPIPVTAQEDVFNEEISLKYDLYTCNCSCSYYNEGNQMIQFEGGRVSYAIPPGGRLNKKDGLTRYGDSHVKDKTS